MASHHMCARERKNNGQPQTFTAEYIRANIRRDKMQNTRSSEQKPTWETSVIHPRFVLHPLHSEEKHHLPLMCFPSRY